MSASRTLACATHGLSHDILRVLRELEAAAAVADAAGGEVREVR